MNESLLGPAAALADGVTSATSGQHSEVGADLSAMEMLQAMFTDDCVFHPTRENYVIIAFFCVIFCLSVVGNSIVVLVILQQKSMRSVTNLYLLNLALSDLLLSVVCMPPTLVSSLVYCWVFGDLLCKLLAYLQPVVVTASAYTLAAIALERYYAICRPLHSRVWHTKSHAMIVIGLVWLISVIANLLMLFMYELRTYNKNGLNCAPKHSPGVHFAYQIYMTIVLLVVPLILMTGLYGSVISTLRTGIKMDIAAVEGGPDGRNHSTTSRMPRSPSASQPNKSPNNGEAQNGSAVASRISVKFGMRRRTTPRSSRTSDVAAKNDRLLLANSASSSPMPPQPVARKSGSTLIEQSVRSTHSEKIAVAKQRLVRMLIVIVIIFFCCWTPSYIWWLVLNAQDWGGFGSFNVWNSELNTVITVLTYVSSCTNPITYCFLNSKFRNALFVSFGCRGRRGDTGRIHHTQRTTQKKRSDANNNPCTLGTFVVDGRKTSREIEMSGAQSVGESIESTKSLTRRHDQTSRNAAGGKSDPQLRPTLSFTPPIVRGMAECPIAIPESISATTGHFVLNGSVEFNMTP